MASIYLYAELLVNIRQVTVLAILPSKCHQGTWISLLPDQKTLHVQHEDLISTVELPCQIANTASAKIPQVPSNELSFRLSVSPDVDLSLSSRSVMGDNVPWPASKLMSETQIACQSCSNPLIKDVTVWKDLPSGGWADMMDFWHCHKPGPEDGSHESFGSTKGYAAANDLSPTAGVGLVDVGHILFAEVNCTGMQVCR